MSDDKNIKTFGKDDEGLKSLGKLLSNETSRKIMVCLRDEPMYINQIAKKLNLQMNLVIHHIKLLEDAGLLITTKKKITRKGVEHTHYQVIPNIFINITETKEEHEKSFFKRIFRDGIKFVGIGIAAVLVWMSDITHLYDTYEIYPVPLNSHYEGVDPIIPALIVIIIGMIIERAISIRKNKKRG